MGRGLSRLRDFFGSMAGHIFVLLTIGMSMAAILALLVAEQARKHDIERFRIQRVVASAADIAARLRQDPARTENMLANQLIMGAAAAPDGVSITQADLALQEALAARFGANSKPEAGRIPVGLCFPLTKLDPNDRAAGLIGAPRPDCWIVRFTDATGQRRSMALDLPRIVIPPSSALNPLYLLLIVAASAGLAIVVARFVAMPLRRLERAAETFSLSLDPEPIPERGPEEVRAALSTFNLMQQRVRAGFRDRTQLLAAISHDLQTPLTRLRLRLEHVQDEELRARLLQDHHAMLTLVKEGLDLASSAESQEEWSMVDIDSLLRSLVEDAQDAGEPVRFLAGCGEIVRTKPNTLSRCVTNLIDNAVKYGGNAEVRCERDANRLSITIKDHGPGIPDDQLTSVFEPFTRGAVGQAGGRAGTGIGLTIAKSLAANLGATLLLENAKDGGLRATMDFSDA